MELLKKLLQISRTDKQLRERLEVAEKIARQLADISTAKEKEELATWLSETPEHEKEIENIRQEIIRANREIPDTQQMWKEFEKRIPHWRRSWRRVFQYAAILFLAIGMGVYGYFKLSLPEQETPSQLVEKIVPGEVKARLVLANGEKIDITKETAVKICEASGARIATVGSSLYYKSLPDTLMPTEIHYNTLIVPLGGEYALQLSDGTKVWLNAGSQLKYPVVFQGKQRDVELSGEGYFEVQSNAEKPFRVQVNGVSVRVLGTTFNISAYRDRVTTTLISGKVSLAKGEQAVELSPGEQAVIGNEEEHFRVQQVKAENFALWKEGVFWFEDMDLATILDDLARWYNVEVFFVNPGLKDLRFSMEMKRYEDITTVLRKLEYTRKVKFSVQERTIIVSE